MPELPEVETIRAGLERGIVGQMIQTATVLNPKTFDVPSGVINQIVVGSTIKRIHRRAKVLMWDISNGYTLMFHLKMTGQVVLVRADGERFAGGHPSIYMAGGLPDRSTRVIFGLASGDTVYFNDQRKFGWVKLIETNQIFKDSLIKRLGPEPLSDDFTLQGFQYVLTRHGRAPIKAVILDQSTVSGIGNIYADESLHLAKIHPQRLAGSLDPLEVKRLHKSIKTIISLGIKHGGTSFTHYLNALGGRGDYLEHARVFRRTDLMCPVCGTIIEKIRVAGRGTHFCPTCQKL